MFRAGKYWTKIGFFKRLLAWKRLIGGCPEFQHPNEIHLARLQRGLAKAKANLGVE